MDDGGTEDVRLPAGPVVLRRHHERDVDGVVEQCRDRETIRWTTIPVPYERGHAEYFVRRRTVEGWAAGDYLAFAIADAVSDEFLGTIDLTLDGSGAGEVGFGLHPAARGRGVMTAAVNALADWAFSPRRLAARGASTAATTTRSGLGLRVLHWRAQIGNWPSRRVAWRTGFRVEGVVRGLCAARGQRYDGWIGSLCPDDPRTPVTPWYDVPRLSGVRCSLRRFRETDVEAVTEACSDPVTQHWLGGLPSPYTTTHALGYVQSREEEHASGRGIYWAAADPVSDRCIGSFALMDIDRTTGSAEIGYWVHPRARGGGVATEATQLIVRHAAMPVEEGGLGLRRVALRTAVGNLASQRVAERAGFVRTGRQRQVERLGDGTLDDLIIFDLLTSEIRPPIR